ncbi:cyclic nucleotide-binding domain-containing protein [Actinoallomurus purpureus]|uniref:cyclic nucleotide-binding domain-containing protein n=1 Tax=Actinoallomurus purpureus TaxID=478114 RepID=UPI002092321E|nr:cyclic nucleotide-binding domain-containing protein [Actinoallomurus purpureus]MCO6009999.1 cyclic nucleotide-binding domain-containing protein [Actinoallomurus purpureus]
MRGFDDGAALEALADGFVQREYAAGDTLVKAGAPADHIFLIARGKLTKYSGERMLGNLTDGDYFGEQVPLEPDGTWSFTVRAVSNTTVLALPLRTFQEIAERSESLRSHIAAYSARQKRR